MNVRGSNSVRFFLLIVIILADFVTSAAPPPLLNDPVEGQKLARELREMVPVENAKLAGVLKIVSPSGETREVPLRSSVTVAGTNWTAAYEVGPKNSPTEVLLIRHSPARPSEYEWRRGSETMKLDGNKATNSFAGSDFALLDLGLEFFHWPTQMLVTREMRKGRGCDTLESKPAQASLYSRIVSWLDQDTRAQGQPGLIMADGYDSQGKLFKQFEIKKITTQGEVRELEIRNRQTKGSTRLQFESGSE
jgi:hypothetical protein